MKKSKKILIIYIICICFTTPIFARYYEKVTTFYGKGIIAEPIIIVEPLQDTISMTVDKESVIDEYSFKIKNYECEENGNKRINETDFLCNIEIVNSNNKFPISYKLYDCTTGKEILEGKDIVTRNNNSKK